MTTTVAPPSAYVPTGCATLSRTYSSTVISRPLRRTGGAEDEATSARWPPLTFVIESPANSSRLPLRTRLPPSTTIRVPAAAARFVSSNVPATRSSPASSRTDGTFSTRLPSVSACEPVFRNVTNSANGTLTEISRADASASSTPFPLMTVVDSPVTSRTWFVVFASSVSLAYDLRKRFVTPEPMIPFASNRCVESLLNVTAPLLAKVKPLLYSTEYVLFSETSVKSASPVKRTSVPALFQDMGRLPRLKFTGVPFSLATSNAPLPE